MLWFDRLYPACLILAPALVALCVKAVDEQRDRARERALVVRLWGFTVAALSVHVALQLAFDGGLLEQQGLRRGFTTAFPLLTFFPLWFACASPLLALRNPGWRAAQALQPVQRSASLAPRHTHDPVSRGTWVAGWTVFAGCVAGTIWAVVQAGHPLLLLGLAFWPAFAAGARASRLESEPRDAAGSPELAAAWAGYRSFRAHAFLVCGSGGSLMFASAGVLMAVRPEAAGLVGGLGGALVGVAGGVFGTLASFKRARIQRLLAELASHDPAGA